MSAATTRVSLAEARAIADELVDLIGPSCKRIEIAGSIRRRKSTIGDIDLVCEPILEDQPGLFGDAVDSRDLLHEHLTTLVDGGVLAKRLDASGRAAWGMSLKRATFKGLAVDIQSVTDPATWGFWILIRTGPAEFNKRLVTPRIKGGWLPPGFSVTGGFQLFRWGERMPTPTEHDVFELLGLPCTLPEQRS